MRILSFSFETTLQFSDPVSEHSFVLRCLPKSCASQTVLDSQIIITPHTTVAAQVDGFGNLLQVGRIAEPHSEFNFISSGMVVVDTENCSAEPAHPMFLRDSSFAATSGAIRTFAADALRVACNAPAWDKAMKLSHALHEHLSYKPGATDVSTTAAEAFELGCGVCQDYAHILIAACRTEGICARYVNGLIVGEGATHAWVEVHDGDHWRGIDPTHDCAVTDEYIALSRGRDFSDCAIESGVFRGGAQQSQNVIVHVVDQASRL
ncbi:transglutaminase family protein [Adlercreutzia sp. ZJ138]|uniref:transglutaminase family protein n=1 Tax=Adlercreutzia sp. ZJ138 TaxID=2709405 RepID=UPI0013EA8F0B|nr:transglutaminase family protein [Adlercreutzia sp. ZJ138]